MVGGITRVIHELLDFTQSHNGLDDLGGLVKAGSSRVEDNIVGADTDDPRAYIVQYLLTISLLTEGLLKLYGSKAVTVDNVVLDKLRGHRGEVRLTNLVIHISLDNISFELSPRLFVQSFPLHPFVLGEQGSHVVGMKVITDLSKLGGCGSIRPRQDSIRGRLSRRCVKVVTQFLLLFNPFTTKAIPLHPLVSNLSC